MIRKSLGPLCFTFLSLLFIQFIFQVDFSFISSLKSVSEEVEMKDIYFSSIQRNEKKPIANIVLIDIDTCKRAQLMDLFKKVQQYQPKVVGVDVLFKEEEPPSPLQLDYLNYADTSASTVFACVDSGKNIAHSFFAKDGSKAVEGLVNFGNTGEGHPIRSILNKSKSNGNLMSFSAKVASIYNSSLSALKKIKEDTSFNITYIPVDFPIEIKAVDIVNDSTNAFAQELKNKIVLIGALDSAEDKHKITNAGYAENDGLYTIISGLRIHAIAIAMLLNDNLISEPSAFWNHFFTLFVFLLFFYIFFYLIEYHEFYYELTARLVMLISSILMLFFYVLLMKKGIEIELGYLVTMIIFISGILDLYKPVTHLLKKGWKKLPFNK